MVSTSSIMTIYLHLQPSLPPLLAATGVISDAVNTSGVVLALIVLTLVDVSSTVIALKSRAAVAGVRFRRGGTMPAIKTFILKA